MNRNNSIRDLNEYILADCCLVRTENEDSSCMYNCIILKENVMKLLSVEYKYNYFHVNDYIYSTEFLSLTI